jgi:hypothetical protein
MVLDSPKHWEAAMENFMFTFRMMGKKYAKAYVTVVVLKNIYASQ